MKKVLFLSLLSLSLIGCQTRYAKQDKDEVSSIQSKEVDENNNKVKAIAVLKSLESGDPTAIQSFINPKKYIQHNLAFTSGRDTILGALSQFKASGNKVNIKRVIADRDLVAIHTDYGSRVGFDVYRFENGQIVEHWDNLQSIPAKTVSGRTMTDGPVQVTDLDKTEYNKNIVRHMVEAVLIGKQLDKSSDYVNTENYYQHNPNMGDNLSGFATALEKMAKQDMAMEYTKLHKIIGEGNFVLTMSEGKLGSKPVAFYDLFRLENYKIVEHWDTVEEIPAKDKWKNENGKF